MSSSSSHRAWFPGLLLPCVDVRLRELPEQKRLQEGKILTSIKRSKKEKNSNHLHLLRPDLCTEAPGEDQEDRDEGEHQQDDGHLQSGNFGCKNI